MTPKILRNSSSSETGAQEYAGIVCQVPRVFYFRIDVEVTFLVFYSNVMVIARQNKNAKLENLSMSSQTTGLK